MRFAVVREGFLSDRRDIVPNYRTFAAHEQSQCNLFRFVMMHLVQEINGSEARTESERRSGCLSRGTACNEWAHQRVSLYKTLIQTLLRSDRIRSHQAPENAEVDLVLKGPKDMLAGRIGKRTAGRCIILGPSRRTQ